MNDNRKWALPGLIRKLLQLTGDATESDDRLLITEKMGWSTRIDSERKNCQCHRLMSLCLQKDITFDIAVKLLACFDYKLVASKDETSIDLNDANEVVALIKHIIKTTYTTIAEVSRKANISYQTAMRIFSTKKTKVGTLVKIFNALDYEVLAVSNADENKFYTLGDENGYTWREYQVEEFMNSPAERLYLDADTFYKECCVADATSFIRLSAVFDAYIDYASSHRFNSMQQKDFTRHFSTKVVRDEKYYYGIKLKEN